MKIKALAAVAALTFVAACGGNETETAASCTMEELQTKTTQLMEGLQTDPSKAQQFAEKIQELTPRLQEVQTGGEPSQDLLNELCAAYDELLGDL